MPKYGYVQVENDVSQIFQMKTGYCAMDVKSGDTIAIQHTLQEGFNVPSVNELLLILFFIQKSEFIDFFLFVDFTLNAWNALYVVVCIFANFQWAHGCAQECATVLLFKLNNI